MRKRWALLIATVAAFLLLTGAGCGGGSGNSAGSEQKSGRPTGDTASASEAYAASRNEISRLLSAGGQLSQIVGRNVDESGLSSSWDFIVLGPEREGTVLKEHHIVWNKGRVEASAVYDCDTLGYENSPSYSHLFNPVEEGWMDSPRIAQDYQRRYPASSASLGTLEMRLRYYRDPDRGLEGTYWEVVREGEQRGLPHALFDAVSGSFAGEISVL